MRVEVVEEQAASIRTGLATLPGHRTPQMSSMSGRPGNWNGAETKEGERMGTCLRLSLILGMVLVWYPSRHVFGSERPLKSRTFQLTYQATIRDIPRDVKTLEAWVPLPQTDLNQTIHQISINAPVPISN